MSEDKTRQMREWGVVGPEQQMRLSRDAIPGMERTKENVYVFFVLCVQICTVVVVDLKIHIPPKIIGED